RMGGRRDLRRGNRRHLPCLCGRLLGASVRRRAVMPKVRRTRQAALNRHPLRSNACLRVSLLKASHFAAIPAGAGVPPLPRIVLVARSWVDCRGVTPALCPTTATTSSRCGAGTGTAGGEEWRNQLDRRLLP